MDILKCEEHELYVHVPLEVGETEECTLVCVTYPSYSQKYIATVCMAGITSNGELRRIYPVTWEEYQTKRPKVGERIRYKIRETATKRKESCKIYSDSIEIVSHANSDSLLSMIKGQCTTLCDLQDQDSQSLGFIQPTINDLSVDESSNHRRKAAKYNEQITLEGDSLPVMILPYQVRFHFDCSTGCETDHAILCEDIRFCNKCWEFEYRTDNIKDIEEEYVEWMTQFSDLYFMVGTHHRWGSWLVISLLSSNLL